MTREERQANTIWVHLVATNVGGAIYEAQCVEHIGTIRNVAHTILIFPDDHLPDVMTRATEWATTHGYKFVHMEE